MDEGADEKIRLTSFSKGAGCGCKISPSILEEILKSKQPKITSQNLLVGNESRDDAAVYDIGNGRAIISTTDFFMPVVDDPFDFGRIASANAISDVYAMGGRPLFAVAILGWPVEKLAVDMAQQVLDGARAICAEAGIPLAGGHSIDSAEPIFGLAVTGEVLIGNLKKNNTACEGDILFITKPIGVGVLSTAQKRGLLESGHGAEMIRHMSTLNKIGEVLGKVKEVSAMTDITGFGLLGHLMEMAEGSGLSAELHYSQVPILENAKEYLARRIVPDATYRNWNTYSSRVQFEKGVNVMEGFNILPDPQTNGGLLFSVHPSAEEKVRNILKDNGIENINPIGKMIPREDKVIHVKL